MTYTVTKTLGDICSESLRLLNKVEGEDVPSAEDMVRAAKVLQRMLTALQAEGATIWLRRNTDITLAESVADYEMDVEGVNIFELVDATILNEDDEDGNEQPVEIISREDYFQRPNKVVEGKPTQVWFSTDGDDDTIQVWPTPDDTYTLRIDYRVKYTGAEDTTTELEFPDYWLEAMTYRLADRLAAPFGVAGSALGAEIKAMAKDLYDTACAYDVIQDGGGEVRFVLGT